MFQRLLSTILGLTLGFAVLLWGLVGLQRVFHQETDEARRTVENQRQALEQYAQRTLGQYLREALRRAEAEIPSALEDPLVAAGHLLAAHQGEQSLPRRFSPLEGSQESARELFLSLASGRREFTRAERGSPWARRLELHRQFVEAVKLDRPAEIETALRTLLSHRLRYRIAPALDIPAMLALLDFFERESSPAPELMRALLLDGLEDGRGARLRDLSRLLLEHREAFTGSDFDFLCEKLVDLAARTGTPYLDFLERSRDTSAPSVSLPAETAQEEVLLEAGRWFARHRGGRWTGVAIRLSELLERVTDEMRQRGLLDDGEAIRESSPIADALPLRDLELRVESGRWERLHASIEERFRLKSVLVVFCAALAVVLAALALALQVRRQRLLELRSEFVATVSHELRTPLASVRLMAETVARRAAGAGDLKDYPARIVREIDTLTFLVDNILSFNRLEKGRVEPRRRRQSLTDLVDWVRGEIELQATREVVVHDPPQDLLLSVDPDLAKLLLLNLVRNGYLYNERDPVEIRFEARAVAGTCEVLVRDNGWGIPESERGRVFEEFYRPRETGRKVQGTGLGLALCRRIMALHGGRISIAESGAEGTVFRLEFPAERLPRAWPATLVLLAATASFGQAPVTISDVPILSSERRTESAPRARGVSPTIDTARQNVSTWKVEQDSSGYALARSYLDRDALPPAGVLRVGDFMNAFATLRDAPVAFTGPVVRLSADAFPSVFRPGHYLLHVAVESGPVAAGGRKGATVVAVLHCSEAGLGSVREALAHLVDGLGENDRFGIVAHGSRGRVVLAPEPMAHRRELASAVRRLSSSASADLGGDLLQAYEMLERQQSPYRSHHVLLFADGFPDLRHRAPGQEDVDLGEEILALVRRQVGQGALLSVVGFGDAGLGDPFQEQLARAGDGHYFYADHAVEARRLASEVVPGTLAQVARNVRAQVVFDPGSVARYRFFGEARRWLAPEGFTAERVDGGELSAGRRAVGLYELSLTDRALSAASLGQLRVRYETPEGRSRLLELELGPAIFRGSPLSERTSVAAAFAEKLAGSYWARDVTYEQLLDVLQRLGPPLRTRATTAELVYLVRKAARLDRRGGTAGDDPAEIGFEDVRILE